MPAVNPSQPSMTRARLVSDIDAGTLETVVDPLTAQAVAMVNDAPPEVRLQMDADISTLTKAVKAKSGDTTGGMEPVELSASDVGKVRGTEVLALGALLAGPAGQTVSQMAERLSAATRPGPATADTIRNLVAFETVQAGESTGVIGQFTNLWTRIMMNTQGVPRDYDRVAWLMTAALLSQRIQLS